MKRSALLLSALACALLSACGVADTAVSAAAAGKAGAQGAAQASATLQQVQGQIDAAQANAAAQREALESATR